VGTGIADGVEQIHSQLLVVDRKVGLQRPASGWQVTEQITVTFYTFRSGKAA
jgi:hypothetical protein